MSVLFAEPYLSTQQSTHATHSYANGHLTKGAWQKPTRCPWLLTLLTARTVLLSIQGACYKDTGDTILIHVQIHGITCELGSLVSLLMLLLWQTLKCSLSRKIHMVGGWSPSLVHEWHDYGRDEIWHCLQNSQTGKFTCGFCIYLLFFIDCNGALHCEAGWLLRFINIFQTHQQRLQG